jgi:hypothetical protein
MVEDDDLEIIYQISWGVLFYLIAHISFLPPFRPVAHRQFVDLFHRHCHNTPRPAAHNLPQWTADLDISSFDLTISINTMKRGVNIENMSMDGSAEACLHMKCEIGLSTVAQDQEGARYSEGRVALCGGLGKNLFLIRRQE